MTGGFSARRAMLLAGTFGTLVFAALPAVAQQTPAPAAPAAAAPLPPGSPLIGRPDNEGAMKLAPVAPPPLPATAEKLATVPGKLKLQKGFNIELYAGQVPNARSMRQGEKGTVFVGSRLQDKVHYITESGGKREVKVLVSGLYRPNGLAIKDGTLYIAELSKISKIEKVEDNLTNAKPVMIYDNLPKDEAHGWKFIGIGPDNKLYVPIGQPCNNCLPPDTHAQIRRINLDGSGAEVVARGVRQIVGMDWHPTLKQLYFTENARDWLSEELPNDKLNRMTQPGKDNFGYPYCHQGDLPDPEFGWGHSCDDFTKPVALLGPHSAPLGIKFYTGNAFPAEYRGQAFIARHGSWNKSKKIGGDIVVAKLNADGTLKSLEPFLTGFLENNNYVGRPVDLLVMKDGSLLISDDYAGAIYRVSYSEAARSN